MTTALRVRQAGCLITLAALMGACSGAEIERCVARQVELGEKNHGFELIDLASKEVWLTTDWEVEEFEEFSLPFSWSLWRKNDPRIGAGQTGQILRSPGCEPGKHTYMSAHGREFVHVVNLENFGEEPDGSDGLINAVTLNKHHSIRFDAGDPIEILSDPTGQRYVLVARTLESAAEEPSLPDGWTLAQRTLSHALDVALDGEVTILRMDNKDSFQGPIAAEVKIRFED